MRFQRRFTIEGQSPYEGITFVPRTSRIAKLDGTVVFEAKDVMVPDFWDQTAVDILAQKYFRRRGCNFSNSNSVYHSAYSKSFQGDLPVSSSAKKQETDLRETIHRIVGCWTHWGSRYGYFDTDADAQAFYDELSYMLAMQMFAPNSPQWFNTGLHFAYGIEGDAQGHYYVDPDGEEPTPMGWELGLRRSTNAYEHPQTSACQPYHAPISTPTGPVCIGDIVTQKLNGLQVFDRSGVTRVVAGKSNGVKPVLRVVTKSGHAVEATADHQILVKTTRGVTNTPYWTTVGALVPGQCLVYRGTTTIQTHKASDVEIAEAFLAGWLQGDGHVGLVTLPRGTSMVIEAMTADADEHKAVMDALALVFPDVDPNIIEVETVSSEIDLKRIRFYGKERCRPFVEKYGLLSRRQDMRVPPAVVAGGYQTVVAYLRALFQADGYVSSRVSDDLNTHIVALDTISEVLMGEVHTLLANLGIFSRIKTKKEPREDRQDHYTISIQVKSEREKFAAQVGFVSERKQSKLLATLTPEIPGRTVEDEKALQIERIEYLGEQEVFDIQTESENYLSGNIVVHNCFIQSVSDDLVNEGGIMDLWIREARLFKYGSGSGSNYSKIRGTNEPLSGGGVSSGLMSFLKVGDAAGGAIKSGGTSRRAAKMVILDVDHPDIEAFINWKVAEEHKVAMLVAGSQLLSKTWQDMVAVKDDRNALHKVARKAMKAGVPGPFLGQCLQRLELGDVEAGVPNYTLDWEGEAYGTVSAQNANNSVRVTDEFMRAVAQDGQWALRRRTDGSIAKQVSARSLWNKISHAAWMCADPGVQFHDSYNNWHTGRASGEIRGTNPCVVGSTLVSTEDGYRRIDSLVGKTPAVVGLDGDLSVATKVFPTGTKPVYRLTTKCGYTMDLTADHRVWTENRGDVPASLLTKDDVVRLQGSPFGERTLPEGMAEVIGLTAGDGCITADRLVITMNPDSEREILERAAESINGVIETTPWGFRTIKVLDSPYTTACVTTHNQEVVSCISSYLVADQGSHAKRFTDEVFSLNKESLSGILRGLFTADGTVANYGEKSHYISLDSCSLDMLQQVQVLLLQFGVKSKLYKNRRTSDTSVLPDGKGGTKAYSVLQIHSLRISRSSRVVFEQEIGFFPESHKASALADLNAKVTTYLDHPTDYVTTVEPLGEAPVYDLTEPRTSHFVANGITVHNCSEYAYLDDTACNLASVNLGRFWDAKQGFDLAAYEHACYVITVALEITVAMSQYPSEKLAKNSYEHRTLGLGYANLGALLMHMGLPYDSESGRAVASALTAVMTGKGYLASIHMAKDMGPFPAYQENAQHVQKVLCNHAFAAGVSTISGFVGLNHEVQTYTLPAGVAGTSMVVNTYAALKASATNIWRAVVETAPENGVRNAQISVLAPTGTIGLVMGCDTTGVEPDFAIVKFKKLAGGGYMKLTNGALEEALTNLGYSESKVEDIRDYVLGEPIGKGHTEGIHHGDLLRAGYDAATIQGWDEALLTAFDPSFVLPVEELTAKFGADRVRAFLLDVGGRGTVEGAPHLDPEHYAIFDCANRCGKRGTRFISPYGHLKMMAATQPFISGSISKTVNLPAEADIETFSDLYWKAWKWGVKAVALYRDGSKMSQPLATNLDLLDGADVLLDEEAPLPTKVEVVAQAAAQAVVQKVFRDKLPTRRGGYTQAARIAGTKLYLRTGEYADGRLGEIFLDMHKEGAAFRSLMNSFAIAVSIGLQYGVPLEEYCDAFIFTKFEPQGVVQGHPAVKMSTSVLDYIFRDLAISYLDRSDLAQVKPEELLAESGAKHPLARPISKGQTFGITVEDDGPVDEALTQAANQPVAEKPKALSAQEIARQQGYTGDACPSCGHATMVRSGTCLRCTTCGTTTGCS